MTDTKGITMTGTEATAGHDTAVEHALSEARRYWQWGTETRAQVAITTLAQEVERLRDRAIGIPPDETLRILLAKHAPEEDSRGEVVRCSCGMHFGVQHQPNVSHSRHLAVLMSNWLDSHNAKLRESLARQIEADLGREVRYLRGGNSTATVQQVRRADIIEFAMRRSIRIVRGEDVS